MTVEQTTETQQATSESVVMRDEALKFVRIETDEEYKNIGQQALAVAAKIKFITEKFSDPKKKAHAAWKSICNLESEALGNLEAAKKHYGALQVDYEQRAEAVRQAEQARLQQEAQRAEEDARVNRAAALEKAGKTQEAVQVLDSRPAFVPAPVAAVTTPKQQGVSTRSTWKFRVKDFALVPEEYKLIDEASIGAIVRVRKELTNIPGIEVYEEQSKVYRG